MKLALLIIALTTAKPQQRKKKPPRSTTPQPCPRRTHHATNTTYVPYRPIQRGACTYDPHACAALDGVATPQPIAATRQDALAEKCHRLEYINMARSELLHKTSDVALLYRKMAEMEVWAATLVEAGVRGRGGRKRAVAVRDAKRSRWKEMFDEDSQRPFFYNQITGEIRWRRPQDLLELMKRPTCGNCEYFEAAIECGTCKEFYCNDCFGQVHYGGKRAGHPFRALYDAYGRRVDYGDGDFELESMWPSEIVQDDVAGILLRISPHREPVETVGTWQRYADPDTGTSYYYRRPRAARARVGRRAGLRRQVPRVGPGGAPHGEAGAAPPLVPAGPHGGRDGAPRENRRVVPQEQGQLPRQEAITLRARDPFSRLCS